MCGDVMIDFPLEWKSFWNGLHCGIQKCPSYKADICKMPAELILNTLKLYTVRTRWEKNLKHARSREPAFNTCTHGRYPANIQSVNTCTPTQNYYQ